jgi:hypothetical protein
VRLTCGGEKIIKWQLSGVSGVDNLAVGHGDGDGIFGDAEVWEWGVAVKEMAGRPSVCNDVGGT